MTPLVVDASAAIAWLVRSQSGPVSEAFIGKLDVYELIAPDVFAWEMANLLRRFALAGVLDLDEGLGELSALDIRHAPSRPAQRIYELAPVAFALKLSVYDTAYLALAVEADAELVSRDRALLTAARAHAIPCHDLSE
ncbi:hypothetical protein AWH62_05165 [Maricaulis sp. W15]|uniref:type II toxin-antitoxin system VapC family toxin n=1 Tax=Maricaulis sp. W15 TaxID=1772333 RepID=UPI000948B02F|nr:type II toxin-antitoxin system VapC family toxin [Maricaulis sp. W15]OLF78046.1 hypothetical protein AWH62_05165 [Maricaulis sp. W15]